MNGKGSAVLQWWDCDAVVGNDCWANDGFSVSITADTRGQHTKMIDLLPGRHVQICYPALLLNEEPQCSPIFPGVPPPPGG